MIKPPGKNKSQEGFRALFESFAQLTPPTAFLSRLYQTTFPSNSDIERQEWEVQVSTTLNSMLEGSVNIFGRIDFNEKGYSWGRSQNVSSLTDHGVGQLAVNLLAPINEDYIVDVQADDGDARVTQKSGMNFSIEIYNDGKAIDSGFVFIVRSLHNGAECSGS